MSYHLLEQRGLISRKLSNDGMLPQLGVTWWNRKLAEFRIEGIDTAGTKEAKASNAGESGTNGADVPERLTPSTRMALLN